MMSFVEWCSEIELRYDRLPRWFFDNGRQMSAYREYQNQYDAEHPHIAVELSITKGELDGR